MGMNNHHLWHIVCDTPCIQSRRHGTQCDCMHMQGAPATSIGMLRDEAQVLQLTHCLLTPHLQLEPWHAIWDPPAVSNESSSAGPLGLVICAAVEKLQKLAREGWAYDDCCQVFVESSTSTGESYIQ